VLWRVLLDAAAPQPTRRQNESHTTIDSERLTTFVAAAPFLCSDPSPHPLEHTVCTTQRSAGSRPLTGVNQCTSAGFPDPACMPESAAPPLLESARHVKMSMHGKEPPGCHPRRPVVQVRRVWDSSAERSCDPKCSGQRTASVNHTRSALIPQRDGRSFRAPAREGMVRHVA
jgi:hypothetical protein